MPHQKGKLLQVICILVDASLGSSQYVVLHVLFFALVVELLLSFILNSSRKRELQ